MGSLGTRQYNCVTQDGLRPTVGVAPRPYIDSEAPLDSLVVGIGEIVPRWDNTPPRPLRYWVATRTFPTDEDAQHAAEAMEGAAQEWNALELGITITPTATRRNAHFHLVYSESPPRSTVLASAFFPNEINQDITVYSYAFEAEGDGYPMQAVFLHELGHVLGLRHEFALDPQTFEGQGAVRVFGTDPNSVMSYQAPPTMQESDREGTRAFYALRNGHLIGDQPVTDYAPRIRERIRRAK